ncbi:MAG: NADH-quinone oxidoreductase subunit NuoB [Nitrososphaerota archaeon]|nr:NADH-quinone oxidoreductase subunit NuoB [Nitrososphaerota archaeon]
MWVLRGLRKGILTTGYPGKGLAPDEVPRSSFPPTPSADADWAKGGGLCPTGAIQGERVDAGRCVYCRRCKDAGFRFEGPAPGPMASERAALARRVLGRSLHVLVLDVGSCNGCNMEVLNLANPYYDFNRLGIFFTNTPKHADVLLAVGALNKAMVETLKRTYESMPEPKFVVAAGACAMSGGVFKDTDGFASPLGDAVPVDVEIPGCPPTPLQLLDGLLLIGGRRRAP